MLTERTPQMKVPLTDLLMIDLHMHTLVDHIFKCSTKMIIGHLVTHGVISHMKQDTYFGHVMNIMKRGMADVLAVRHVIIIGQYIMETVNI